jgi:hypothetical protein
LVIIVFAEACFSSGHRSYGSNIFVACLVQSFASIPFSDLKQRRVYASLRRALGGRNLDAENLGRAGGLTGCRLY